MDLGKEEFLNSVKAIETLRKLGGEWQVSSSPFGCKLGYSKVYLRRKRNKPSSLRVHIHTVCLSDEEADRLKSQIRTILRKMEM